VIDITFWQLIVVIPMLSLAKAIAAKWEYQVFKVLVLAVIWSK